MSCTCAMLTPTRASYARRPSSRASSSLLPWSPAVGACRRRVGVRRCLRPLALGWSIACTAFPLTLPAPGRSRLPGGGLYLILFKDDATRMGWIYPLRSKSAADVASATK